MKEFRTVLKITPADFRLELNHGVLTQGSCFSEAIGNRLNTAKVKALVNPFGVIYNPESIHQLLTSAIFNEAMPDHTFTRNQEIYVNYNFHSSFSSLNADTLRTQLADAVGATHYFLKDAKWLMLTYGSAWVYRCKDTGEVVANCHKLPQSLFSKELMRENDILDSFKRFYKPLLRFNPDIRIILTISPVRHLRDTLELNSVSKGILRLACHDISQSFANVEYFPAYEIMIDDLRDYRFYKTDLLHPTTDAEDYIWEKFMERYFSQELKDFTARWKPIQSALRHKPFHPGTAAHQQFLKDTLARLEEFRGRVDVTNEVALIKQQINK